MMDDALPGSHATTSPPVVKTLDAIGDGRIDIDEFKSLTLKANDNDYCELYDDFNEVLFSPSHTSDEEFVTGLEIYTRDHRAVTHHLLANLACASFGKKETADMLLMFLSAYTRFNSRFTDNVETLLGLLDDEKHVETLGENLREEMGEYDEETLLACEAMGIRRESVMGIPHRELFKGLVEFVETVLQRSYVRFIPKSICEELNQAIDHAVERGRLGLLSVLYFGSELIVPSIYSSILQGLRNSIDVSNEDAKFLILHIDMDQDHARALREIITKNCRTKADRLVLARCTKMLLDARVAFYDSLIRYSSLDPMSRWPGIHDEIAIQSNPYPVCMSDFTGRPVVFEMCKDHVRGSTVLDVGCGAGHVARQLVIQGATKIVGVDINGTLIKAANSHPEKNHHAEYYVEGSASNLKATLLKTTKKTNLMPGAQFDVGLFDLSVASFVFNCLTITDMDKTFRDIFALLKPGGYLVFSVPHPLSSDGSGFSQHGSRNYFALRDKLLEDHVSTISGERFKSRTYSKTFGDYMQIARKWGFEISQIEEVRVNPELLQKNPAFFDPVNGVPLDLVVKLRKPVENNTVATANPLGILPKKLNWNSGVMRHSKNAFVLQIPDQVKQELYTAARECFHRGIDVDDLDVTGDFSVGSFASLKSFAVSVRNRLLHETGLVLLKGLDLEAFGSVESVELVACSKIAYYLLCDHIGTVDGSARGRLFDVMDCNINAVKSDNVLFSVSNCEADWHTDGASKDKIYDAVSLLCIHPSGIGGRSKISNACNAYDEISRRMPKFLLHELHRPVSRDMLENGKGNKTRLTIGDMLSRSDSIMPLRISYNSYPIFDVRQGRIRFRYMRHWIETAHKKMRWGVPTLLRIAMDVLDDTLDKGCCFRKCLERGDILMCNNAIVAHGRDSFQDIPGEPHRHLVRAWMQIQTVDLLKPSNQSAAR